MPIPTEDPTKTMTIDEKITVNTQSAPATFDITLPVVPGHDMVINHLDGTQELGTGNEATAIATAEAEAGQNVPLSDVQPQPEESTHRSVPDPETNQPNPVVAPVATVAPAEPVNPPVNPPVITPVDGPSTIDPVTSEPEATEDAPAEPTSADVADV